VDVNHGVQLVPPRDPELGERPVQMGGNGARGKEQALRDLAVGQALGGQGSRDSTRTDGYRAGNFVSRVASAASLAWAKAAR
jgi:hypothetical protein